MGIGRAIGSVLLGLGEGLEKQGEHTLRQQALERAAELQARRDAAIEAIRSKNQRENAVHQADLNDRNNARNDARDYAYGEQKGVREHAERKELKIIDLNNERSMARLRESLGLQSAKALAEFRDKLDSGEIRQVLQDKEGNYFSVDKDGNTSDLGRSGTIPWSERRPTEDPDEGDLLDGGGSSLGRAAGAAVASAAKANGAGGGSDRAAQAKVQLSQIVATARSDPAQAEQLRRKYPQMFNPDGSIKSNQELIDIIDQAYGG